MDTARRSLYGKALVLFFVLLMPSLHAGDASADDEQIALRSRHDRYEDALPEGVVTRLGTIRFRFKGQIYSIAYAPGGTVLASGGEDSNGALIRLWDVSTGKGRGQFRFSTSGAQVNTVAFSPDGRILASCANDAKAQLWDLVGKSQRPRFELPTSGVSRCIGFSPDGKILATGGLIIRLWDPVTGKLLRSIWGHFGEVVSLVFSPDGKFLASGGLDRTIRIWRVETGEALHRFKNPGSSSFLPGGIFIPDTGPRTLPPMAHLAFSPDGKTLACSGGKCLVLWDMATGKEVLLVRTGEISVGMIAFSPDGKTLACGYGDRTIRLWDVRSGKPIRRLVGFPGLVDVFAYSPGGKILVSGGSSGTICFWDVASGRQIPLPVGHQGSVASMAIAPNGRFLASGSGDCTIRLWDLATGREMRRLLGHAGSVESVAYSPDGSILASGSGDKTIRLWDVATGRQLRQLGAHDKEVVAVAFAPDGKTLASGSCDRTIRVWDVRTGKELLRIQGHGYPAWVRSLAFSPDGKVLASGGSDEVVYLWDAGTGEKLRELHNVEKGKDEVIYGVTFSPNGKSLVSATARGKLCLWDLRTGKAIRYFKGHPNTVTQAVFSPDGKTLASIDEDSSIRLWEVTTVGEVRQVPWTNGHVFSLAFAPDGKTLACGGDGDCSILVWDLGRLLQGAGLTAANYSPENLETLWHDLESLHAARAYQVIWKLVAGRRQAVAFLQTKLSPVQPVPAKRFKQLMEDLDSPQFAVRQKAAQELEGLRDLAEPFLVKALAKPPSVEVQKQAEALLKKLEPTNPERLRIGRAVSVLEYLATPEARALLEKLAQGSPDAWLTQEARASLKRLAKLSTASKR